MDGILTVRFTYDGFVKNPLLRHSRAGGNLERIEITGSKSTLISRLRGNDRIAKNLSFNEYITYRKRKIRIIGAGYWRKEK